MPWEGSGTRVITPEACLTVCLAVLEVIPDKAEGTRRGTSCQVAGVFEECASRGHPTPPPHHRKTRKQGRKLYPHPPAEYAPVTHRNAGVAGGAQINHSGAVEAVILAVGRPSISADIVRSATQAP